jgi:hypothetical protein
MYPISSSSSSTRRMDFGSFGDVLVAAKERMDTVTKSMTSTNEFFNLMLPAIQEDSSARGGPCISSINVDLASLGHVTSHVARNPRGQ